MVQEELRRELNRIVADIKKYLEELKNKGIEEVLSGEVSSPSQQSKSPLYEFYLQIKDCQKCHLAKTRTNFVFGEGNPDAELVFVGEAPGYHEDQQGRPFVGRAGHLLTRIIEAMGLKRGDVYICNVLKCRPPNNRTPTLMEITTCKPYLVRQLELLKNKKVICALGAPAAHALLGEPGSVSNMRGKWYSYQDTPLIVTYHPAYLLRNPADKKKVWEDMQKVMKKLCL